MAFSMGWCGVMLAPPTRTLIEAGTTAPIFFEHKKWSPQDLCNCPDYDPDRRVSGICVVCKEFKLFD